MRIVDRFLRNRKLIEFAWVASYPLILWATGWVAWANSLGSQGLGDSLVLLLLFAPSLAFIALMELSAAQLEEILDGDHGDEKQRLTWGQIWRLRLRLGEMANLMMCLAPVLFIAIGSDLLGWFKLSETSRALVAMAVAMSGILLLYPIALARWMRVQSVGSEHPIGARIEQLRQQVGLGSIKAVIVRSNGRWHGAAVVGWLPQLRSLWLGDALIDKLEPEELDMVILHEIAHVKRRHFLWRMMPMLWAAGVGISYKLVVDAVLVSGEAWPFWITQGLGIVLASLVLIYGLGYSARACELDADWSACELAAAHCEWTRGSCIIAAVKMDQALSQILGDSKEASGRTWLHPSLQERSQSLTNASGMLEHRGAQNESIEVPA